jgi:hypothetical protein
VVDADGNPSALANIEYYDGSAWVAMSATTVTEQPSLNLRVVIGNPLNEVFVWWEGDLSGPVNEQTLVVNGDKTIKAVINSAGPTYNRELISSVDGAGKIQFNQNGQWQDMPANGVLKVPADKTVNVRAVPTSGNVFLWWIGSLSGQVAQQPLLFNENKLISAAFNTDVNPDDNYLFNATLHAGSTAGATADFEFYQNGGWQIIPAGGVTAPAGTTLQVRIVPTTGTFSYWAGDVIGNDKYPLVTMDADKSAQALLVVGPDRFIKVNIIGDGTVEYADPDTYGPGVWFQYLPEYETPPRGILVMSPNIQLRAIDGADTFVWWEGDADGTDPAADIAMTGDKVVTVVFASSTYTITADTLGPGTGSVQYYHNNAWQPFPAGTFGSGSSVLTVPSYIGSIPIKAQADIGNIFIWWLGDLSGQVKEPSLVIDGNKNVTARFNTNNPGDNFMFAAQISGAGKIQYTGGGFETGWTSWDDLPEGNILVIPSFITDPVSIRAVEDPSVSGNRFIWWTGGIHSTDAQQTFVLNVNTSATAVFSANNHTVSASVTGVAGDKVQFLLDGQYIDFPGTALYLPNSVTALTVKAVPAAVPNNVFVWWTGDLAGTASDTVLSLNTNKSINAVFSSNTHLVTAQTTLGAIEYTVGGAHLSFPAYPATLRVPDGFTLNLRLVANGDDISAFATWEVGAVSRGGTTALFPLLVDADKDVTISFVLVDWIIDVTFGDNGNAIPPGVNTIRNGGSLKVEFAADGGYQIRSVIIDGATHNTYTGEKDGSYFFGDVRANHTIYISFERQMFYITLSSDSGAELAPSGKVLVAFGGNLEINITTPNDLQVADIIVDGTHHPELAGYNTYKFSDVKADHTLQVVTGPKQVFLLVNVVYGQGKIEYSINGGDLVPYTGRVDLKGGETVTVKGIAAKEDQVLKRWAGSSYWGTQDTVTFENVHDPVILNAEFGNPTPSLYDKIVDGPWIWVVLIVVVLAIAFVVLWLASSPSYRKPRKVGRS